MSSFHIESLPPMLVARVRAFGQSPESAAWEKLRIWAEPLGLLNNTVEHPIFGFNNPSPSPGDLEYGYEFWVKVENETPSGGAVEFHSFPGGEYAVSRCNGYPDPEAWMNLYLEVIRKGYLNRKVHELERMVSAPESEHGVQFDLYLPVESS